MGLLDLLQGNGAPEEPNPYAIRDISDLAQFNFGQMDKPEGIVIHHTGGGGTPEGVMNTFQQRGLAAQFIMDRDGNVFRALPEGMRGQHIRPSQINGLTNANTLGIEIIAKDDSDLTDKQREAAARWLTETQSQYGIPAANVFGHGEINSHRQATEGNSVVSAWRGANRIATPDLGEPAAPGGSNLPMSQRTLMAYAGRDAAPRASVGQTPFDSEFEAASKETGIPVAILKAQTMQESTFDPNVVSKTGGVGLLQIQPSTARQPGYGVDPLDPSKLTDPAENIRFGARYLAARAKAEGVTNWNDPAQAAKGLTAYNGGGDPNYAQNVFRYLNAPGGSASQTAQRPAPLNPSITAAAERGQGPAADRPARGNAMIEGPRPMPALPMADTTTSDNGGVLEFLRQQSAPVQNSGSGGFTIPGTPQTVGGLGGLGGIPAPAPASTPAAFPAVAGSGGGFDPGDLLQAFGMSLMTSGRKNPLENFPKLFTALSAASETRNKSAQEHAALATALVSSGMPVEQAKLYAMNPTAAQIGLKQITDAKARQEEAAFNSRLNGPQQSAVPASEPVVGRSEKSPPPINRTAEQPQSTFPSVVPSQAGPGSSWSTGVPSSPSQPAQGNQPQPARGNAPPSLIDTGNRTTDVLFGKRASKVAEYAEMSRNLGAAPTDRAKSAVEGRLKAIEKDIGQLDKQIETYAPTGSMREYTFAMVQRQNEGLAPVPFERWDPEQVKKDAVAVRGAATEEVSGLRKEIQGLPSYKNISQAAPIYKSMMDAVGRDTRASDVNMIYGLAKIMDPTSVVRESEMTVAQAIATLPQQIQQNIKSQLGSTGRLSKDVREGIMQEAYSRMNSYNQLFGQDTEQYRGIAQRRKMDLADVIPNFGDFKAYEPPEAKAKPGANGTTGAAPALREVPSQYVRPDGSSPPMPSASPPPTPPKAFTKSDWDKLEPGTLYTDAKGDTRRKGGN
jgi:soluble lytic murein transglycosylase-like protein